MWTSRSSLCRTHHSTVIWRWPLGSAQSKCYRFLKSSEIPLLQLPHPESWPDDISSSISSGHMPGAALILISALPFSPMSSVPSIIYFFSLSPACYIFKKKKKSNLPSQDYITSSIYLCSCIPVSLPPKRQRKAMPEIACPWWSLPGADKAEVLPRSSTEASPRLSSRNRFLALLFSPLSFSYVLVFGTWFCFLFPKSRIGLQQ